MKVKIFQQMPMEDCIETQINDWLKENNGRITIKWVTQSEDDDGFLSISIWYF